MIERYSKNICPVCGKGFHPESCVNWGWKIGSELNPKLVCSYSCMREWEKNPKSIPKPKRRRKAVRIVETGRTFESVGECAIFFKTTRTAIYNSLNHKNGRFKNVRLERVVE